MVLISLIQGYRAMVISTKIETKLRRKKLEPKSEDELENILKKSDDEKIRKLNRKLASFTKWADNKKTNWGALSCFLGAYFGILTHPIQFIENNNYFNENTGRVGIIYEVPPALLLPIVPVTYIYYKYRYHKWYKKNKNKKDFNPNAFRFGED